MVNGKVFFEKEIEINFKIVNHDLDGFNQDGFNGKGFDRNGFNINGIDEKGFSRNKELNCEEKIKRAVRETPWIIYNVSEVFRSKNGIMKECIKSDLNTYQYATLHLKQNVNLAIFFFLSVVACSVY